MFVAPIVTKNNRMYYISLLFSLFSFAVGVFHVRVRVCLGVCCDRVSACACVCVCESIVTVTACGFVSMCVLCVCVCVCVYVCVCVCVCICVSVCMCLSMRAHACVPALDPPVKGTPKTAQIEYN